jgi:hypothetical protein
MGADEKELEELLRIKRRRLFELRKQAAELGRNTPPEVRTEIADLTKDVEGDIKVLEPVVAGALSDDVLKALRQFGIPASLANSIQRFEESLYELKQDVHRLRDDRNRRDQTEHKERETRQLEVDHRFRRMEFRLTRVEVIGVMIFIAIIGGFIGYAFR